MENHLHSGRFTFNFLLILLNSICASSQAQWLRKTDALQYRSDLSESIIYKSKLYTFLGFYDHDRHLDSTSEVYDPATDTYTLLAPIPGKAGVTHEKIVLIDSTVWLIGGRLGQNPGPLTSAIWMYNISKDAWYKGPVLKDPATGDSLLWAAGGAALLGRTLHVFGGFVINACNNDQSKYHLTLDVDAWLADTTKPAEWKNELTPLPLKRNHFSTVVLGGKIYAIGGQFGHDCGNLEKPYAHVYDPATDTWKQLPLLPDARSHAEGGSFAIDGKIFIVGGQDHTGASTNKVTIFNPAGNSGKGTWEDDTSLTLPGKFEGETAKIINSTFIFSHGGEGTSAKPRNMTYTRTVKRNPVYKLGFSSGCLRLQADSGASVTGKTLLFTIDSSTDYLVSSNTGWLTVTKNANGITMANGVDILITANTAGLNPGDYRGTLTATGADSGTRFTPATYCVRLTVKSTNPFLKILEAETAGLNGALVANNNLGFSGTGFANYINASGDYVEWTFNKLTAGGALLKFRYSNGRETDRPLQLSVNGIAADTNLSFPSTGNWENWALVTAAAHLNAGLNTVRLTAVGYSGPNIDYLSYTNDTSTLAVQKTALKKSFMAQSYKLLKVYVSPNPASGKARLILNTSSLLPVNIEVADMSGRVYKKLKVFKTGSNSFSFSAEGMSPGIYIIKVRQGKDQATTKFLVYHTH